MLFYSRLIELNFHFIIAVLSEISVLHVTYTMLSKFFDLLIGVILHLYRGLLLLYRICLPENEGAAELCREVQHRSIPVNVAPFILRINGNPRWEYLCNVGCIVRYILIVCIAL